MHHVPIPKKMTQPNENTFYVTFTSQPTSEFPNNSPTRFQFRLPQSLWLQGKWKVGLVSVFLPGLSNPIPHVVTSHHETPPPILPIKASTHVPNPFRIRSLHNLYRGSDQDVLFQQYANAFKTSLSQPILSQLKTTDLQDASNGFDFLANVFWWMQQDLNKQLPTGYAYEDGDDDRWRLDISAQDNNTTWLLRSYKIDSTKRKPYPYFAMNLILAQQMGWVKETASNVYAVGPNLLMELADGIAGVKPDPSTCNNTKLTFTQPIHVVSKIDGLVYLSSVFNWRFVNLNEAFDKAIHQPYETSKTSLNAFKPWMVNLTLWQMVSGVALEDYFVDLPVSPHYWKPRTLSVTLEKGVRIVKGTSHGVYLGELWINMSSLTNNKTYTVALEWYQKDAWLFNRSSFLAEGTGLTINNLDVKKHTHEHNKTHLIYYHTLTIQFTKLSTSKATLQLKFDLGFPLPTRYDDELKHNTFLVLYGVEGFVSQVPDVFDDHPVIHTLNTTTKSVTTSTASKKTTTVPTLHGTYSLHPLFLSCNITKHVEGNNFIMKTLPYKNQDTLIDCNPIQFYSLRGSLIDILTVSLTEAANIKRVFHPNRQVIVTLLFKKKVMESQRKYIRLDEATERDQLI